MDLTSARAAMGAHGLDIAELVCISLCLIGVSLLFGVAVMLIVGGLAGALCIERASALRGRARAREAAQHRALNLNERVP